MRLRRIAVALSCLALPLGVAADEEVAYQVRLTSFIHLDLD